MPYIENKLNKKENAFEEYEKAAKECLNFFKTNELEYYYKLFDKTLNIFSKYKIKIKIDKKIRKAFKAIPTQTHQKLRFLIDYERGKNILKKLKKERSKKKYYNNLFNQTIQILD